MKGIGSQGPTQTAVTGAATEWAPRPVVAAVTRGVIFAAPYLAGFAAALAIARFLPAETVGVHTIVWWIGVAVVSTLAMIPADRFVRRFMPLAGLLNVSLGFPDAAPSRFAAAMRSTTTNQVRRRVEDALENGSDDAGLNRSQYLLDLLATLTRHDRLTRGHSERVRAYATLIGEQIHLSKADMQKLYWAALLHDIGKLDVPEEILNKPGRPDDVEWEIIKGHPEAGLIYLKPLEGWLGDWIHAADEHHLRWDGNGYPNDKAATEISLAGRIVAIADAYDVMTSTRSYKAPLGSADARIELLRCAGTQFDPNLVKAFLNIGLDRVRLAAGPLASLPVLVASLIGTVTSTGGRALLATTAVASGAAAPAVLPDPVPAVTYVAAPAPDSLVRVDTHSDGAERIMAYVRSDSLASATTELQPEDDAATATRDEQPADAASSEQFGDGDAAVAAVELGQQAGSGPSATVGLADETPARAPELVGGVSPEREPQVAVEASDSPTTSPSDQPTDSGTPHDDSVPTTESPEAPRATEQPEPPTSTPTATPTSGPAPGNELVGPVAPTVDDQVESTGDPAPVDRAVEPAGDPAPLPGKDPTLVDAAVGVESPTPGEPTADEPLPADAVIDPALIDPDLVEPALTDDLPLPGDTVQAETPRDRGSAADNPGSAHEAPGHDPDGNPGQGAPTDDERPRNSKPALTKGGRGNAEPRGAANGHDIEPATSQRPDAAPGQVEAAHTRRCDRNSAGQHNGRPVQNGHRVCTDTDGVDLDVDGSN